MYLTSVNAYLPCFQHAALIDTAMSGEVTQEALYSTSALLVVRSMIRGR